MPVKYRLWDVKNIYLDVSSWELFLLLLSAHYTEYLICFACRSSGEFVILSKKMWWVAERSDKEIAGERWALINRKACRLLGSQNETAPSLFLLSQMMVCFGLCTFRKKNIHTLLLTSAFVLCFCLFMLIKPEPSQLTQALQYPTDFLWKYFSSWTSQIQPIQCDNTSLLFPKFWLLEQASFGWMDGSELFIYFFEISRWILFLMQPSLVLCFIHCVMLISKSKATVLNQESV